MDPIVNADFKLQPIPLYSSQCRNRPLTASPRKFEQALGARRPERGRRAERQYLGFANGYLEQLFRALAAVHPKGVRITDAGWRLVADQHVRVGLFSCAIDGGRTYWLTYQGVRRAVAERLMKDLSS